MTLPRFSSFVFSLLVFLHGLALPSGASTTREDLTGIVAAYEVLVPNVDLSATRELLAGDSEEEFAFLGEEAGPKLAELRALLEAKVLRRDRELAARPASKAGPATSSDTWAEVSTYQSSTCASEGYPKTVSQILAEYAIARAAEAVWDVANRSCTEVVVAAGIGGNGSLACVVPDEVLLAARAVWEHVMICEDDFDQAALQTILARQDYLKSKIEAQDTTVDLLLQGQLEQLIHRKGGSITTMLYADRLEEVCEAARVAIEKAAVHYKVHRGTQPLLDEGLAVMQAGNNPKKAYNLCKRAYNHATSKSTMPK